MGFVGGIGVHDGGFLVGFLGMVGWGCCGVGKCGWLLRDRWWLLGGRDDGLVGCLSCFWWVCDGDEGGWMWMCSK